MRRRLPAHALPIRPVFTGIVRALGTVTSIRKDIRKGGTLVVDLGALDSSAISTGDSIAVNGACLTVAALDAGHATFAVSPETLACCLVGEWTVGERLNLEPALTLQTPLGGHLVSGHIDGTGTVVARHRGDAFTQLELDAPRGVGRLIAVKGAITVDGVSLTINEVSDHGDHTRFAVMLVPHTLETTTLGALQPGARVHLEADPVARYVQRLLESKVGE